MGKVKWLFVCLTFGIGLLGSGISLAKVVDSSIASCLKAWGKHPFGAKPKYTTLATSVKVFGIGQNTADTQQTNTPSLVLVNPGVNVMGGSTVDARTDGPVAGSGRPIRHRPPPKAAGRAGAIRGNAIGGPRWARMARTLVTMRRSGTTPHDRRTCSDIRCRRDRA